MFNDVNMATDFHQHAEKFVSFLRTKGYFGKFSLEDSKQDWSCDDELYNCLLYHLQHCRAIGVALRPFTLKNIARFVDEADYTECEFLNSYDINNGFIVKDMKYQVVKIARHHVAIDSNDKVPKAHTLQHHGNLTKELVQAHVQVNGNEPFTSISDNEKAFIQAFASELKEKGYTKCFDLSARNDAWQVFDSPEGCLTYYLMNAKKYRELPPFTLRTYAYYKDDHDFLECFFKPVYDHEKGFHLEQLKVVRPGGINENVDIGINKEIPFSYELEALPIKSKEVRKKTSWDELSGKKIR